MKPYFQQDGITIYHGDSYELLPALVAENKFDLCITDPPYVVAAGGGWHCQPPGISS
jgi:DNA modification methylase